MDGLMMNYPLTLVHLLERVNQLFGKVEVVSRLPDRSIHRYTYADFYRRARQLAKALQQAGIQRGDRVATLMWNHYRHLEAYFGIPACGAVTHTLNLVDNPELREEIKAKILAGKAVGQASASPAQEPAEVDA